MCSGPLPVEVLAAYFRNPSVTVESRLRDLVGEPLRIHHVRETFVASLQHASQHSITRDKANHSSSNSKDLEQKSETLNKLATQSSEKDPLKGSNSEVLLRLR